ncbi:transglutaminase domain-containing protein [Actinoplanes teichomyceticus]|uniref:Transglutaminase superfamily protein n=1 Tax=Actinoplanes teichomyceticus TaxID=1867 RepID=A0A561WMV3_ACTTI|nr:transglutaminase domain-containing protein [Actinoplanes teichomyceticus]TWG25186.1 transglutaminase superfamily protein [Actinoplanes teichomyceticus]GIF10255.1 hypothetical protein Ate01nite_02870 [Actinoplanes teichomyceticus]
MDYTRQTRFSDPGRHHDRLAALPADPAAVGAVVRNLTVHYRASGIDFPPDRLADIDARWAHRMLDLDRERFGDVPFDVPRPAEQRVVGCCRDSALLTVAALRSGGIAARSRVGFAGYLTPGYHVDHVIVEYHDGVRWIATDTGVDPAADWPVDVTDVPLGPVGLHTAAQAWQALRRGELDPWAYGTGPGEPIGGPWMIRYYLAVELAHRLGDELLLWDLFGEAAEYADRDWADLPAEMPGDLSHLDETAGLLVAADAGDHAAERELGARYAGDARLRPGPSVRCVSPRGAHYQVRLC